MSNLDEIQLQDLYVILSSIYELHDNWNRKALLFYGHEWNCVFASVIAVWKWRIAPQNTPFAILLEIVIHTCFYISAFLRMWAFMYMYVYYAWLIFAYGHIIQGNFLVAVMLIFFSHSVTWAGPETPQSACCICTLFKILYGVQSHLSTIKVFSYTCCLFPGSLLIVACFNAVVDLNCGIIVCT